MSKPRVLVLGGVGFIGRSLVKKLVDAEACSLIRVCDKSIPVISYCSAAHRAALEADVVEFSQCDLVQDAHLARAFDVGAF
jgi:nucleoside-diphosphate-sugar epimerase